MTIYHVDKHSSRFISLALSSVINIYANLQEIFSAMLIWKFPPYYASHWIIFYYFSIFTVDLLLKAVGDTPIMKQKKWAVERGRTVQSLSQFISRFLKLDANEQLVRKLRFIWFLVSQKSLICVDTFLGVWLLFFFLPHSSFMLTSHLPLHRTKTLESFLMWELFQFP